MHLGSDFAHFSEYALISLKVLPDFDSTIRRFESSRPSQAVMRPEKVSLILAERPANGGLLRIGQQSPGSDFGHSRSEIADSLRRTFGKFPFAGDCDRRPGSISTAWPNWQYSSRDSPPLLQENWECRACTAAPTIHGQIWFWLSDSRVN